MAGVRQKEPRLLADHRRGRGRALTVPVRANSFLPPPCPDGVGEAGREAWESFWRSDVSLAVDVDADAAELRHWVRCVDERERLWKAVKEVPLIRGSHGQLMRNPLVRQLRELTQDIERTSDRFGMNPLARFRLQFTVSEAGRSATELLRLLSDADDVSDVIDLDNL